VFTDRYSSDPDYEIVVFMFLIHGSFAFFNNAAVAIILSIFFILHFFLQLTCNVFAFSSKHVK